jgi:flagellar export protein FliJ
VSGRYPLDALLGLREREEDGARGGLAQALAREAAARAERDRLQAALAAHSARRAEVRPAPSAAALHAAARFGERLRREERALAGAVDAAQARVAAAAGDVERARQALADAARAREVIVQHRVRWDAARRRATELAEESERDDLAAARARGDD